MNDDKIFVNKLKRKYKFNSDLDDKKIFENYDSFKNAFMLKCDKCKQYYPILNYEKYDRLFLLCNNCK